MRIPVIIILVAFPFLWMVSGDVPTLRELTVACRNPNESVLYCGSYPPDCEKSNRYTCELLMTVRNYDLPCILGNLNDRYIQALCSKRATTYLFTILRNLPTSRRERSCREPDVQRHDESCKYREFVGVSFKNKTNTSGTSESELLRENDVVYACIPGDDHNSLYTFDNYGENRVSKFIQESKDNSGTASNPYENIILPDSGIGVLWVNMRELNEESTDLGCQFVLSVSSSDLDYNGGNRIQLYIDEIQAEVVMAEGWTTPNIPGSDLQLILKDPQGEETTSDPQLETSQPNPTSESTPTSDPTSEPTSEPTEPKPTTEKPPEAPRGPPPKIARMGKCLDLSKLLLPTHVKPGSQDRKSIEADEALHSKHWEPVYDICQTGTGLCYTLGDKGCYKDISESCEVLVAIQFVNKCRQVKISLIVENAPWGGISFSKDREMGNDVGFYCQSLSYTRQIIKAQLHEEHIYYRDANDTMLEKLVANGKTFQKKTEDEKLCTWTIPTKFKVTSRPKRNETWVDVDLRKDEFFIQLAIGNNLGTATAHHRNKKISDLPFSYKYYKDNVRNFGTSHLSHFPLERVFLTFILLCLIHAYQYLYLYI